MHYHEQNVNRCFDSVTLFSLTADRLYRKGAVIVYSWDYADAPHSMSRLLGPVPALSVCLEYRCEKPAPASALSEPVCYSLNNMIISPGHQGTFFWSVISSFDGDNLANNPLVCSTQWNKFPRLWLSSRSGLFPEYPGLYTERDIKRLIFWRTLVVVGAGHSFLGHWRVRVG